MRSTTFVARRPGPFSALVQTADLGGLHLEALPPVRVTDRYYDTGTGDLLRRALALRVREQGGRRTVGLRALESAGPLPNDLDLPDSPSDGRLVLPSGAFADAVRAVAGPAPLDPLLSLRQYRTPRVARDGGQTVGMLSFDVVVCEAPGARAVSNEVEVEVHGPGPLARLAAVFEAHGVEPAERSAFARAVLRLTRTLAQPVLLLPDEARALEQAAASGDSRVRRRARVVLLDARGAGPDAIAAQAGMSVPRVLHWQRRFREVRLDALDLESSAPESRSVLRPTAAYPPETPSPQSVLDMAPSASAPLASARPSEAPPQGRVARPELALSAAGDGMPAEDATGVADMAELLDLFAPSYPDTPHLGDMAAQDPAGEPAEDADDEPGDDGPGDGLRVARPPAERARAVAERTSAADEESPGPRRSGARFPSPRLNPYPVVLGPVSAPPSVPSGQTKPASVPSWGPAATGQARDPFAEVDLRALRRDRPAEAVASGRAGRLAAPSAANGRAEETPAARGLRHSTPILEAAHLSLSDHLGEFDAQADSFLASRAPSAARRLLIAVHRLRLAAETFGPALPSQTARQIAAGLRPLAERLGAALDATGAAALHPGRRDLARDAAARLDAAGVHLDSLRQSDWRPRAHRLLAHLERQRQAGLPTSDFAPPAPDDLVGQPGDAPVPTRLRHVLGSAVWRRFEALRAFEDDLAQPTTDLAAHLAVALSSLRFVVRLADPAATDIAAALEAAEREVTRTRHHAAETLPGSDLSVVPQVWAEVVARPFRERLAAVVAGI